MSRLTTLLACAATLVGNCANAQLTALATQVTAQYAGPGLPNTVFRDPWVYTATIGNSFVSADLSSFELKALAEWPAGTGDGPVQIAYASGDITLQNDSAAPVLIGPITMSVNALATQGINAGFGGLGQFVNGILSTSIGSQLSLAQASWSYGARRDNGGFREELNSTPTVQGSGVASILTATPGSFEALLTLPAFSLNPGANFRLLASLQTGASADVPSGWSALTDASHSARLSMQVPAGLTINSSQPLRWITPVPEVPAAWLALGGLVSLWGQRRWSRRQARAAQANRAT